MGFSKAEIDQAMRHLRRCDSRMNALIRSVGAFKLKARRDRFAMLVNSILSQQISTAAARSIKAKLLASLEPNKLSPESLQRLSVDQLRMVGISRQKANYILDLTHKVNQGDLNLQQVGRLDDEGVIAELVQVKGIGRWTAQMFLIFSLGRLDVFPEDDLGIKNAIKKVYELDVLPERQLAREIAAPWRPFASVASWYLWRALENTGNV